MSWLSALRGADPRQAAAATGSAAGAPTADAGPEIHRSLALPAVFSTLARGHRLNVLDLGPAIGGNVERLSEFSCKLYIEDLYASRSLEGATERLGPEFFAQLIAPPEGTQFDL